MSASQSSQPKRKREEEEDGKHQLTTSSRVHVWGLPKNSSTWMGV